MISMRRRFAVVLGVLALVSCGDDDGNAARGTEDGSSSSSTGAQQTSAETSSSSSSSSTTSSDESSSSSGAPESSSSTTGTPIGPPQDEDFEWDEIEPFDCGPSSHTILASGSPSNRVNLIFLGDGYVEAEVGTTYADHVDQLLDVMFGPGGEPNRTYSASVNICRIDVVSNESGIDFPDLGIDVDTALNGTGSEATRLAFVNVAIVNSILDDALGGTTIAADWVAVTVNTERWVAAGGYPMIWPGGQPIREIGIHEAGHTFHALADEYNVPGGPYEGTEPAALNVTADPRSDKWEVWLGYDQPQLGEIGFYEGGQYADTGIWRPTVNGRMRSVQEPHNAPSVDKMIRDIYAIARPIDDFSPKVASEFPPALGVRVVDETLLHVDWEVDGEVVLVDAGPRIWTSELDLTPGSHEVTAFVYDPTELVREDRSDLEQRVTWPIEVPADLQPTIGLAQDSSRPRNVGRLELRAPSEANPDDNPVVSGEVPHPAGPQTRATLDSNAILLAARDALQSEDFADAQEKLTEHRNRFGPALEADRHALQRALDCGSSHSTPSNAMLGLRAHGRFSRLVRRLCDAP